MSVLQIYEITVRLQSPFLTPWHADTIFGHLAWAYKELNGEQSFEDWLLLFKEGRPPFILSDAWIKGLYPKPMIPPLEREAHTFEEQLEQAKKGKIFKKVTYFTENMFLKVITGNYETILHEEHERDLLVDYKRSVSLHNTIDRELGHSLQENGVYELESMYLPDFQLLSIFVRAERESVIKELLHLFEIVSVEGFGKKKSIGFGRFSILGMKQRSDLDTAQSGGDAVLWLSHGVPKKLDPVSGWYQIETKYGKVGNTYSLGNNPFKKPFTRIKPGAVFRVDKPLPFYGRMVENIHPYLHEVVQYGYAFAIPIKLPKYIEKEKRSI